jgi:hypothetical protein
LTFTIKSAKLFLHRSHIALTTFSILNTLGDGRPCPAVVALVDALPAFILSAQTPIASFVMLPARQRQPLTRPPDRYPLVVAAFPSEFEPFARAYKEKSP